LCGVFYELEMGVEELVFGGCFFLEDCFYDACVFVYLGNWFFDLCVVLVFYCDLV